MRSTEWMRNAACVGLDPELFFPSKTGVPGQRQVAAAKRICEVCPVQVECGEHYKAVGATYGVWGGGFVKTKNAGASLAGPIQTQTKKASGL